MAFNQNQIRLPKPTVDDVRILFLQLNVWLCLLSVLLVGVTAVSLGEPPQAVGLGFVLAPSLFYFIYVEDRRSVSPEDWTNRPERTRLVQRYSTALFVSELIGLLTYEVALGFLVWSSSAHGIAAGVIGQLPIAVLAAYDRIKTLPTADSIAVGITWAFVVVFAVVVSTAHPVTWPVGMAFVGWFLIVFAGAESRNLEDLAGDETAGKPSLACYLGPRRTILLEMLLKSLGVLVFWYLSGPPIAGVVVGYLLLLRLFRALTRDAETARG